MAVSVFVRSALFKRSTVPTFKSYGIVQARISDCASETFSAIRTVSATVFQTFTFRHCFTFTILLSCYIMKWFISYHLLYLLASLVIFDSLIFRLGLLAVKNGKFLCSTIW
jgi:hypothetical protein